MAESVVSVGMKRLGILGFGSFGEFAAQHLRSHFEVTVYDRRDASVRAREAGVAAASFVDVVASEVLVVAVPVQDMEDVLRRVAGCPRLPEIVVDVASVKVKPLDLMARLLPSSIEVVGSHPMFGPQSGRDGIANLKVVLCPLRTTRLEKIRSFLRDRLSLKVLEMTPEAHDGEMAYIQGLTHWIAKAIREIKLPDLDLSTPAYRHLIKIEEILRDDSDALFRTIQAENPYASSARRELLEKLREIEKGLLDG